MEVPISTHLKVLVTNSNLGAGAVPRQLTNYLTPVGSPIIQLVPDTISPETASDSLGEDLVPRDGPPLQMPATQIQAVTCASDQPVTNQRFPRPPRV